MNPSCLVLTMTGKCCWAWVCWYGRGLILFIQGNFTALQYLNIMKNKLYTLATCYKIQNFKNPGTKCYRSFIILPCAYKIHWYKKSNIYYFCSSFLQQDSYKAISKKKENLTILCLRIFPIFDYQFMNFPLIPSLRNYACTRQKPASPLGVMCEERSDEFYKNNKLSLTHSVCK